MSSIIKVIENLQNLRCLVPLSEKDIDEAEKVLGLKFVDEYRTYTKKFGAISAEGLELTGVVIAPRLNVVNVTVSEKSLNQNIPDDMYVIENTGIDGILMLQNARGEIFSISPSSKPIKKFASLTEYLQSIKNQNSDNSNIVAQRANYSNGELINLFAEINAKLKECRDIEGWYVMTMTVSRDGTFKTDFVYEDISVNLAEYYKDWERKYLLHD